MSGWQDIASAPKDGSVIILTDGNMVVACSWNPFVKGSDFPWVMFEGADNHFPIGCCDDEDSERIEVNGWMTGAPTHWQPLPSPPASAEEQPLPIKDQP